MRIATPTAFLGILLCLPGAARAAGVRYDVSYLWHNDLSAVEEYQKKIGYVLGPSVAKDLQIVKGEKNFGLIYYRHGSSEGAEKAARNHGRILKSRGFEGAAPMRSRDWTFVSADGSSTPPTRQRAAEAKRERDEEIKDLEAAVEGYVGGLRARGRVASDERTAWSVYDFTTGEKLVGINEDLKLQSASLVKPFFALAFFKKVDEGKIKYGPKSRRHMQRMIQWSKNWDTNWVIRTVGGPREVQRVLVKYYRDIFQDTRIVEEIPPGGRTYKNRASVHDYSRFLYALWKDELPHSKEIKRLMSLPGRDRIFTGATEVPKGTKVLNKTGSTNHVCGDMGILVVTGRDGKRYPYTVVGVIEKQGTPSNYTTWIRSRGDVIRGVSNIVYRAISQRHDLAALH